MQQRKEPGFSLYMHHVLGMNLRTDMSHIYAGRFSPSCPLYARTELIWTDFTWFVMSGGTRGGTSAQDE